MDGDFGSLHYHPECRAAEIDYNCNLLGSFYDEWERLCEAEQDNRAWIKATHPAAYLRMRRTREQHADATKAPAQ